MNPILSLPDNYNIVDTATSYYWYDEDGILCTINKKTAPLPVEEIEKVFYDFIAATGDQKVCMLMDVTHSPHSTKETRQFAARELPRILKALAMVSRSAMGRVLANMFLAIMRPPYPVKMFSNEHDAKDWLRKYL